MSDHEAPRRPADAEGDNSWMKWAAGSVVAIALLGAGGYVLWKNLGPGEVATQETYETQPFADSTGQYAEDAPTASMDDENVEPTSASTSEPTATRAPPRRTTAQSDIAEATIGVTPASITTYGETAAADPDEIVVTGPRRPIWSRVPSARRLSAYYPDRALERGREGEASLLCTVQSGGDLDCERTSETPRNAGFGNAALRVARTLEHAPQLADGRSATGSRVSLRVLFRLEEDSRRRR